MKRREFLTRNLSAAVGMAVLRKPPVGAAEPRVAGVPQAPNAVLPGTAPLTQQGDLAEQMVDGIRRMLERETQQAFSGRETFWKRDYSSAGAYERSIASNRTHLAKLIGATDRRLPVAALALEGSTSQPALIADGGDYRVFAVEWPVLPGVTGEGLLLQPHSSPVARVVALPEADWTPEMIAGLAPGVAPAAQYARRLAENGCQVVVPTLMDRSDEGSGIPNYRITNQPHREFIYRMAYQVGRHVIGYEVQKVLAVVDWFTGENRFARAPVAVIGYGEGGLLALYSAALDSRIEAALVSGYFRSGRAIAHEPIYRNVWALHREFGDAELAGLAAPRAVVVEASRGPEVDGPPRPDQEHADCACPNGKILPVSLDSVRDEVNRAARFFASLHAEHKIQLAVSGDGDGPPGGDEALRALLRAAGAPGALRPSGKPPADSREHFNPRERQQRQFQQLIEYTQVLVRESPRRRAEFWKKADLSSVEKWQESTRFYRDYVWDEVIGRMPPPSLAPNPRSRQIYREPKFRGYEVMLDVWPDVFAYGILLVPNGIKAGERRPVVVCQHGLEGRPTDVADPHFDSHYYHRFAARLADEGFVTYAPQNPYTGGDRFRMIQRLGNPLKLALFSFITGQHHQTLNWLSTLPFVDARRIGFYGLSYGGKTAVRVPPLLEQYALSICSGDFNEWIWKTTSVECPCTYMTTQEYDIGEFDVGNIANHAELASLMAPRPFMVERGHHDGVSVDEWVAYEYAKVRRFYSDIKIPDQTTIEWFDGPHEIHAVGTFEFLRKHLHWPGTT